MWCGPATYLFSDPNLPSVQLQDLPLKATVKFY